MSTTINGITAYEVKLRGAVQDFIRVSVVNAVDVAGFDADETAAATTAGTQTVSLGDVAVGGNATGLANDATVYTASVLVNGTVVPIAVTGSAAQTVTTLLAEFNTDLGANATATLVGGNILVTSDTAGNESYVEITDVDLFSSVTGFVGVLESLPGGMIAEMKATTLGNGKSAWYAYQSAVEVYDPASASAIFSSDFTPADLNVTFSDTEVEGEFAAVATKVNALQVEVNKIKKN